MSDDDGEPAAAAPEPAVRGALGAWWRQGLRTAALLHPDWHGLRATPGIVATLVLAPMLAGLLFERLVMDGPVRFYWPGLLVGWMTPAVTLWVCWCFVRRAQEGGPRDAPTVTALFAMLSAQGLFVMLVSGVVMAAMVRHGTFAGMAHAQWGWWGVSAVLVGWYLAAQLALLWRSGTRRTAPRLVASGVLVATIAVHALLQPIRHWYPDYSASKADANAPEPLRLTQELLEFQPQLLETRLQALAAERPGVVDVYAITFAPYAEEGVFMRESRLVASVMQERFGAAGRTLQLVNHPDTVREWPWATPLNLQRAIARAAQRMNVDEDVLFIHLTSHGARSGKLSASFWPLEIDTVTPQMLKGWLDDAGVRFRVISVSACYSGSWIAPLSDPGTLVMTAADADHTSYGCGSGSTLTFFGRAMFDEQLRHTWSFEKAHAAARTVIEQREREGGKSDGYSNPQIRMGDAVRERLSALEAQQERGGQ